MRKKVDQRIRTLIENGVKSHHRSMFVIIGDNLYDPIMSLHYMLRKSVVKSRPKILFCYNDKLDLSSHYKKRYRQLNLSLRCGLMEREKVDALLLFLETEVLTHCLYKDSERIVGQTFGMCILQDFDELTPNLLARTIETVEGGGLIVLRLPSLSSLSRLCTMVMDIHGRFRTDSHNKAIGRFKERLLLSTASCKACVVMDHEFNILPISSHMKTIAPIPNKEDLGGLLELKNLKEEFCDDFLVGPLIRKCCTMDQGRAVVTFMDSILDKNAQSRVALVAARGRGKSAALGLAIAGAVSSGYSNIFVTAPSLENLKTLFDFVFIGFHILDYKEHLDYEVKRKKHDSKKPNMQIDIFKHHMQTIQYIEPNDREKLSQVDLLVIDEAAAIPLPIVKSLLGPYLVFLSSTDNGYEGTGESLSSKLLQELEEQSRLSTKSLERVISGGLFKKIELSEPVIYASGDPVESWIHALLCLNVTNHEPRIPRLPLPRKCDLYYVNRDILFSFHKESEMFLQRMMDLFVDSHYKNSPEDLQLMADSPTHHLFVLLGPIESENQLPDILCVMQVCFEGQISRKYALESLSEGRQSSDNHIARKLYELFQDADIHILSGARIVHIATDPSAVRSGYGSVAVELLTRYFEGQFTPIFESDAEDPPNNSQVNVIEAAEKVSLMEESIKPTSDLPPLLVPLHGRKPEKLHYLGVSFGLTQELFHFWRKNNFAPFYICPVKNNVTGEHSCMVLKTLNNDDIEGSTTNALELLSSLYTEFRNDFIKLLAHPFRQMESKLAMSILDPKLNFSDTDLSSTDRILAPRVMKRLEAYTNDPADYGMTAAFVGDLAYLYFEEKIPVTLSYDQALVLLSASLQGKDLACIKSEMKLKKKRIKSLHIKVMKTFLKYLLSKEAPSHASHLKDIVMEPHPISVDDDLNDGAKQVQNDMKSKHLQQYAIVDKEGAFESALQNVNTKALSGGLISVKSTLGKHGRQEENTKREKKMKRPKK